MITGNDSKTNCVPSRAAFLRCGVAVLAAVTLSGCGDLWEPGQRRVKRRAHDLQILLSNNMYKEAADMCTKDAVWVTVDGKTLPVTALFSDLEGFKSKRAFYVVPKEDKEISRTKISLVCDMRQQVQVGIIDVGNHMWESQLVWVEVEPRVWKISKIRDLKKREFEKSK